MIDGDLIDILNDAILEELEILELKEYYSRDELNSIDLLKFTINDYKICKDPSDIDDRAFNFFEKSIDDKGYSFDITNFQGKYAIKQLNQSLFTSIKGLVDLDLITEFNLIKSNVISEINNNLFTPVCGSLKHIDIYESYLPNIPDSLFRNLDLEALRVEYDIFRISDPNFGLTGIKDIRKKFIFRDNRVGNLNQFKLKDTVKKLKTISTLVEY